MDLDGVNADMIQKGNARKRWVCKLNRGFCFGWTPAYIQVVEHDDLKKYPWKKTSCSFVNKQMQLSNSKKQSLFSVTQRTKRAQKNKEKRKTRTNVVLFSHIVIVS